jgi:transposase
MRTQVFVPLAYEPGQIAQVDFGEAQVILAGELVAVQLFCLRLGYSKLPFVMALPTQAQEAFLEGHVRAFTFLGGVPHVLVYDNLNAAVKRILEGSNRQEQTAFAASAIRPRRMKKGWWKAWSGMRGATGWYPHRPSLLGKP